MSTVDISCRVLFTLVTMFDNSAFKASSNSVELLLGSLLERSSTATVPAAKNRGEHGSRGFADEFCTENVAVPEK